jgi:hypothetical protein
VSGGQPNDDENRVVLLVAAVHRGSTSIANEVVKRVLEGGLAIEIWLPITL